MTGALARTSLSNTALRYEAFTPPSELCGHFSNLELNPAMSEATVVIPSQTGSCSTALPVSATGVVQNSALIHGNYDHWAPRFGLAWRPPIKALSGKHATTVRGGYGMFYNESIYNQLSTELANQFPWANSQMLISQPCQPLVITNIPSSSCSATSPTVLPNTYAIDPNYKVGYAQIWNAQVETNLATNTILSIIYTGTKGTHLDMLFAPNRPAPGSTSTSSQVANAGDFIYDTSDADSMYNAVQIRVQQRTTHGIGGNVIYTYGKSMDDASSIGGGTGVVVQDPAEPQGGVGPVFVQRHARPFARPTFTRFRSATVTASRKRASAARCLATGASAATSRCTPEHRLQRP